jgi:hypothetical protein
MPRLAFRSLAFRAALAAGGFSLVMVLAACGTVRYSATVKDIPVFTFGFPGELESVSADSPSDAWAVGLTGNGQQNPGTLMLHWDGRTWTRVISPAVLDGAPGNLADVTALSSTDAWAVGTTLSGKSGTALLMHWNGVHWSEVTSPGPIRGNLSGLTVSAQGGWAVGSAGVAAASDPLILRWNGTTWRRTPGPGGHVEAGLFSVVTTSAGVTWAVGFVRPRGDPLLYTVTMRWTAGAWQWASLPLAGPAIQVIGLSAGPDGTAWAVGQDTAGNASAASYADRKPPVSMRWTGTTWQAVPVPVPAGELDGVTTAPGGTVWAVGATNTGPLAVTWADGGWARVPIPPDPNSHDSLGAVAFSAAADGWAVGAHQVTSHGTTITEPLILHWNGTAWN